MKTFEKYIQKHLTKLGYLHLNKCKNELVAALKVYKCLGINFMKPEQFRHKPILKNEIGI